MKVFVQAAFIARLETQFFLRFPKLLLASVVVVLIPAIYVVIYLTSVWDPAAHTAALPVAIVNLDSGVQYRDGTFNVGREISNNLRKRHTFDFQDVASEELARALVNSGQYAFALIIPQNFSSNAVPGQQMGAGRLVIYTSEGNNFQSASIARTFASTLGRDVNENLNERRWSLVLSSAAGSQRNVQLLREGVAQLRAGSHELSDGAAQLSNGAKQSAAGMNRLADGVGQLTEGMKQLGSGLRTMDAKRPRNSDVERLRSGAEELANGHKEMDKGLQELSVGSAKLRSGVASFRDEARDSLLVPARVGDGLDQVYGGVSQLDAGIRTAGDGHARLSEGAGKLNEGVGALATGLRTMNAGLRTMVSKLPEDSQLIELEKGAVSLATATAAVADGSQKVKAGTDRIGAGISLLANSLPNTIDAPAGSAEGLATSVQPVVEVTAPVRNSGSAFASNVIPAALWLGAGIAAFLIHVRVLPRHAQMFSRTGQVLGKLAIPTVIVMLQALAILLTMYLVLGIRIVHPYAFMLVLLASALAFLAIVFAMTRAFGDAGKALAMLFLAVQISSSGGVVPVELSGDLFASISPWMPLTWVVRGMKATLFGAYDSGWQNPLLVILGTGLAAFFCACWVGRWRYVQQSQVRPAVDF